MASAQKARSTLAGLGTALLLLLQWQPLACPQAMSEDRVKAAYLYNFAKFVEWPAQGFGSPEAPFRFCVLGDRSIEAELSNITRGKSIATHPIVVELSASAEASHSCQLLFIDASQANHLHPIFEALRDANVLTVGETKDFLDKGGIINFIMEDDRVHFQVNDKAAKQAGLHISSRLLVLAKLVIQ